MEKEKIFLTTGITELKKDKLRLSLESFINKPSGAFWGSSYRENETYKSHWQEWCYNNAFMLSEVGIIFALKENARILVIDSLERYKELEEEYGIRNPLLDDLPCEIASFNKPVLDFKRISKAYDGIHLTEQGAEQNYWTLYGWDCESICLFNLECIKWWEKVNCKIKH